MILLLGVKVPNSIMELSPNKRSPAETPLDPKRNSFDTKTMNYFILIQKNQQLGA